MTQIHKNLLTVGKTSVITSRPKGGAAIPRSHSERGRGIYRFLHFVPTSRGFSRNDEKTKLRFGGFTFVELMVALSITAIILAGIVSIVSAVGTATEAARETSEKQAFLRYAMLRVKDVISQSKLVCEKESGYVVLWEDDYNGNGKFSDYPDDMPEKKWLMSYGDGSLVIWKQSGTKTLISSDAITNIRFVVDSPPPETRIVTVKFTLEENGIQTEYEVSTALRRGIDHLVDDDGDVVQEDDDD